MKISPGAGILSLDARGHGKTCIRKDLPNTNEGEEEQQDLPQEDEEESDWSLETLSDDLVSVVEMTRGRMGWSEIPELVLVGHSLGGAVVTEVAVQGRLGGKVLGYAVLDVVEGQFQTVSLYFFFERQRIIINSKSFNLDYCFYG